MENGCEKRVLAGRDFNRFVQVAEALEAPVIADVLRILIPSAFENLRPRV
tara:strand:- start:6116 stop:6265 length:150 start_codon:yes stop_codon:yes gene_type:complete